MFFRLGYKMREGVLACVRVSYCMCVYVEQQASRSWESRLWQPKDPPPLRALRAETFGLPLPQSGNPETAIVVVLVDSSLLWRPRESNGYGASLLPLLFWGGSLRRQGLCSHIPRHAPPGRPSGPQNSADQLGKDLLGWDSRDTDVSRWPVSGARHAAMGNGSPFLIETSRQVQVRDLPIAQPFPPPAQLLPQ